ncbi:MAG TPA: trigger factor [Candidatus Omnitrophota bacterium]|nr:trigger factor [Candidatus Omnitrophota bacterium]
MKVEIKKIDAIKRELKFQIPKEKVNATFEQVYADIGKVAKVKGFRPGKVPRPILESHYGSLAREEVLKKIIPEAYQEGLEQEKILPIDMPDICDVSFKDSVIQFTAKLEIRPEVKIKDYKGLTVKRKSPDISEEELNKTLDYFKKAQGQAEDKPLDDDFVKGMGYPSLEEFKKFIKRQMELEKDRQNRMDIENQVVEQLFQKTKFAVPQTLLERQVDRRLEEWKKQVKTYKMSDDDIKKKEPEVKEELKRAVEKELKAYFILEAIAQEEKMEIKEGEQLPVKVMEFLLKEAKWSE